MSEDRGGRPTKRNRCPNCGRLMLPRESFCTGCGAPRGERQLSPAERSREIRSTLYGPPSVMQRRLFGWKKK